MMRITMIAAAAANGTLGDGGTLPFCCPEDMKWFRSVTQGHALLMGRNTFESLPGSLDGRVCVVLSKTHGIPGQLLKTSDALFFHDLPTALTTLEKEGYDELMVIGGAQVYQQLMPLADELLVTHYASPCTGELMFPKIDHHQWKSSQLFSHEGTPGHHPPFRVVQYFRRNQVEEICVAVTTGLLRLWGFIKNPGKKIRT